MIFFIDLFLFALALLLAYLIRFLFREYLDRKGQQKVEKVPVLIYGAGRSSIFSPGS